MGYLKGANERRNRLVRSESRIYSESKPLLRDEDHTRKDMYKINCSLSSQNSQSLKSPESDPSLDWDHTSLRLKPDELSTLNEESNPSIQSLGHSIKKRNDPKIFEEAQDKSQSSEDHSAITSDPCIPRSLLGFENGSRASSPSSGKMSFLEPISTRHSLCSSPVSLVNEFKENHITSDVDFSALPFHENRLSPFTFSSSSKDKYGRPRSKSNESCDSNFSDKEQFSKQHFNDAFPHLQNFCSYNQSNASTLSRVSGYGNDSCDGKYLGRPRSGTHSSNCSSSNRKRKTGSFNCSPASSSRFKVGFSNHLHLSCDDSDQDEIESNLNDRNESNLNDHNESNLNDRLSYSSDSSKAFQVIHHEYRDNLSNNETKQDDNEPVRDKNFLNFFYDKPSHLACSSKESSVNSRGRRKKASVVVPPVFAQLVLNANNPYSDFVPPLRESTITCSCTESENCNTCRKQSSNSNCSSLISNELTKEVKQHHYDCVLNDHSNENLENSDKERNADKNRFESITSNYSNLREDNHESRSYYPDYVEESAKRQYVLKRNHDKKDSQSGDEVEDCYNDKSKNVFANGYCVHPRISKTSFVSSLSDQSSCIDCCGNSSELTQCTVDSSLQDCSSDETFKPYDLPFPHESFSRGSLSSNLSNHRSETKINFEEMERDVPTGPMRTSFSAPALTFGCLSSFDENEEDFLSENAIGATDEHLKEAFVNVSSGEKYRAESIKSEVDENTNQIVKRLDKQVSKMNQDIISLSSDVKKMLNLLSTLKNT